MAGSVSLLTPSIASAVSASPGFGVTYSVTDDANNKYLHKITYSVTVPADHDGHIALCVENENTASATFGNGDRGCPVSGGLGPSNASGSAWYYSSEGWDYYFVALYDTRDGEWKYQSDINSYVQQPPVVDYNNFLSNKIVSTMPSKIDNYYNMSCDDGDLATRWVTAAQTDNVYHDATTFDQSKQHLHDAILGNGAWFVQYTLINNGNNSNVYLATIYYVDNAANWHLEFSSTSGAKALNIVRNSGVSTSEKIHFINIGSSSLIQGNGDCSVEYLWSDFSVNQTPFDSGLSVLNDNSFARVFINTFTVEYPSGYTGQPLPSTVNPVVTPNLTGKVSMSYDVSMKHVKLKNTTPSPPLDTSKMACEWVVSDQAAVHVVDKITDCTEVQEFDAVHYGTFQVKLSVLYDINNDGVMLDGESIGDLTQNLQLDGTNYSGVVDGSGDKRSSDYDDCSPFFGNLKIIEGVQCIVNNGQRWIISLVVPTANQLQGVIERFKDMISSRARGAVDVLDWFTNKFIPAWSPAQVQVVCTHDFGKFFGSDFVFNQCALEQFSPPLWSFVTLVLRAVLAFSLVLLVFNNIRVVIGYSNNLDEVT